MEILPTQIGWYLLVVNDLPGVQLSADKSSACMVTNYNSSVLQVKNRSQSIVSKSASSRRWSRPWTCRLLAMNLEVHELTQACGEPVNQTGRSKPPPGNDRSRKCRVKWYDHRPIRCMVCLRPAWHGATPLHKSWYMNWFMATWLHTELH